MKFNLICYKNLLDTCMLKFFNMHEKAFIKQENNYVLAKCPSREKLQKVFSQLIKAELLKYVIPYSPIDLQFYFILGDCIPQDNILLKFKDGYFPKKLDAAINGKFQLKYLLKEKDIHIDILLFNQVFNDIFSKLFSTGFSANLLGKKYKNVLCIMHKNLDCYILLKTIKHLYGKSNCIDMCKAMPISKNVPFISLNEFVDKYIANKSEAYKSKELKNIVLDIKQFIDEKINSTCN